MIYRFDDFDAFTAKARELGVTEDLTPLKELDILFFDLYDDYMVISLVGFESGVNKILVLARDFTLIYPLLSSTTKAISLRKLKPKTKYAESTYAAFAVLSLTANNYTSHFENIKKRINELDKCLSLEKVEEVSEDLKRFKDLVEDLLYMLIRVESRDSKFINTRSIDYEFQVLVTKVRHLLDRAKGATKELNILRDKCDIMESRRLNENIVKLTRITAILAVATLLISVPNTIMTMYGVPPLASLVTVDFIAFTTLIITALAGILSYYTLKAFIKWK